MAPRYSTGRRWANWSGNQTFVPERYYEPRTVGEVQEIVREARRLGKKVRVAATGHAWSPVVPTEDFLVSVVRLKRVEIDAARGLCAVEAGAHIGEVDAALAARGLVLPTAVVHTGVSLVGTVATGCHGAGKAWSSVCDLVERIDMVLASGELRSFSAADGDDLWRAVKINLGAFGIMWRVWFRCQPSFHLEAHEDVAPMRPLMADPAALRALGLGNDYLEIIWFSFHDRAWIKRWNRTARPRTISASANRAFAALNRVSTVAVMGATGRLLRARPTLVPAASRALFAAIPMIHRVDHAREVMHYQKQFQNLWATELAVPLDPDWSNASASWQMAVDAIEAWRARGRYPVDIGLEVRVVRAGDALLSAQAGHPGVTHYWAIEFMCYGDNPDYLAFIAEAGGALMRRFHARPHWGKYFQSIPDVLPWLRASLGHDLERFVALRDGLDPERMFVNPFLERLFDGVLGSRQAEPAPGEARPRAEGVVPAVVPPPAAL